MVLLVTQSVAELVTLLGQHLKEQLPTVVIQALVWWEAVLALVKLQECGLEVHLPVEVTTLLNKQVMLQIILAI